MVAIVDPHSEHLAACKERFNLDGRVVLATDWSTVRGHPEIEAIAIATPASTHYTLIEDALQQGYHVLAEKPLALNVAQCLKLCRLAQQQQRQLLVDHTYLFHSAIMRGREVVQSGCVGELRYGYATRTHLGPVRQDVDALWDLAIHDISIFNTWLGQIPVEVQATGRAWLQRASRQSPVESDNGREQQISNDASLTNSQGLADLVQVKLTYSTGFEALIHLCWLNPDKQRRLGMVGTQGTLIFDELHDSPLTLHKGYLEQNGDRFSPAGQGYEVLDVEQNEPLKLVVDSFLSSIRAAQPSNLSSGWVGAQLVQILCCLEQSLQLEGQSVKVPQLRVE